MFYGNIKPLGISFGVSAGIAGLAIVLMSAGNAIGRLTWGQIHDVIGSRKSILLSLVLVAACITLLQTRDAATWPFSSWSPSLVSVSVLIRYCMQPTPPACGEWIN
jgi:MFS family permease